MTLLIISVECATRYEYFSCQDRCVSCRYYCGANGRCKSNQICHAHRAYVHAMKTYYRFVCRFMYGDQKEGEVNDGNLTAYVIRYGIPGMNTEIVGSRNP